MCEGFYLINTLISVLPDIKKLAFFHELNIACHLKILWREGFYLIDTLVSVK